jgi:formyl-CoA transferase
MSRGTKGEDVVSGERQGEGGPLIGYRVLELGNFIAAPTGGRLFAEFGAEVIKVERPGSGDELRQWRRFGGESSMMWHTLARNKKSVTLDLRKPEGQAIARDLAAESDVVLENFRPGTLERWNLGPKELRRGNPDLVLVRISGYGQNGPYRDRPGFGGIAEALGGLRNLTGYPDLPPTRVGISLGDTVAGMFGLIGALMALLQRERSRGASQRGGLGRTAEQARGGLGRTAEQTRGGLGRTAEGAEGAFEVVDVALYEAVFALLEGFVAEFEAYGTTRSRTGNKLPGIAPSNTYPCKDGKWIVIAGNGDAIFKRLMAAIGRPDLESDPELADNAGRARHQEMLDEVIAEWTAGRALEEVMRVMLEADVPAGPIYDPADIARDLHFEARDMLVPFEVQVQPGTTERVRFPGIVPKLQRSPGELRWTGPQLGEHNDEIYGGLLGLTPELLGELRRRGVV